MWQKYFGPRAGGNIDIIFLLTFLRLVASVFKTVASLKKCRAHHPIKLGNRTPKLKNLDLLVAT
jgi:hypothetical protein